MKTFKTFLLFTIISLQSFAQLQNAKWRFAVNAGADFTNTAAPTPAQSAINFNNPGGSIAPASVSDANGDLLFYTDGINVWNNNNQIIQNGFGLYGYSDLWAQQRVLIVPKPGNANRYYIFTLSSVGPNGGPIVPGRGGIHYSVVDFINGVWQVSIKNIALKNTVGDLIDFPLDPYQNNPVFITTETRMTTALHRGGDKIWLSIIADFYYNQQHTKKFFNYLISSTGIAGENDGNNPAPTVETFVNTPYYFNLNLSVTSMKVSPNGEFLCDGEEVVDLFHYDNQNGNISFYKRIFDANGGAPVGYGIEFSPSSSLVYFTYTPQGIIQSDLRDNKQSLVLNRKPGLYQYNLENDSLILIYRFPTQENILTPIPTPDYCYGLQLAIDNNIYVCVYSSPYSHLGFIDDPDVQGINCNFYPICNPNLPSNLMLPQWVHKSGCTSSTASNNWMKQYEIFNSTTYIGGNGNIVKGINDNLYYTFCSSNIANNINHIGYLPATTSGKFIVQYNSADGTTGWAKNNLVSEYDIFVLKNGTVRTRLTNAPAQYIYLNGGNGNQIAGPTYLPNDEQLLAETNDGNFIAYKSGQIFVHTPSITTSVNALVTNSFFNPITNTLVVEGNSNDISVFSLSGNMLTLINSFPAGYNNNLYHVDNQDNIYLLHFIDGGQPFYKYDNGTVSPVVIPGFNNVSIYAFRSGPYLTANYTSDKCMVINGGVQKIQLLDFSTNTVKGINANGYCFYPSFGEAARYTGCSAVIDCNDNNVYISGWLVYYTPSNPTVTIGNQTINNISPTGGSGFIKKLNIQTDLNFSFTESPIVDKINIESPKSFSVNLSPNPARDILGISINKNQAKMNLADLYKITITNRGGIVVRQNIGTGMTYRQSISNLQRGNYFVTITNKMGEKVTKMFTKL